MAGVVSAGHAQTAEAGRIVLQAGGNAFDAAVAATFMACVVEPTLTSLGGGGFLLAHSNDGKDTLFDFFTQTPSQAPSDRPSRWPNCQQPDFYPIEANFGDAIQEFHIGLGSIAVPGVFAGLLAVHKKLGRLPLSVVVEPAVNRARAGVVVTEFQAYCYQLLEPILIATAGVRAIYAPLGARLKAGDHLQMPEFAGTLEHLASLGNEKALRAFYEGEIAQKTVKDCQENGGFLRLEDFQQYEVIERSPLSASYRGVQLITNPPPSAGGSLIAFCLELLDKFDLEQMAFGSQAHLSLLSQAMRWTNEARRSHLNNSLFSPDIAKEFLSADLIKKYAQPLASLTSQPANRWGSTTHISVLDDEGNAASITTSNGEGSSYVVPGTQIMMNNMLGEEDLNPNGFNQWPANRRMSSMMAPTMILKEGKPQLVLGSGGSNRIRTAILQVISNVVDFKMPLIRAVEASRIHWENGVFHLEPGLKCEANAAELAKLGTDRILLWQQSNMFFGGVHSVGISQGELQGAGDPRRSGAVAQVSE